MVFREQRKPNTLTKVEIIKTKKFIIIKTVKVKNFRTLKLQIDGNKLMSGKIDLIEFRDRREAVKKQKKKKVVKIKIDKDCIVQVQKELF